MSKDKTNGAGKGSRPRPVNKKEYDKNYIRIFAKPRKVRKVP